MGCGNSKSTLGVVETVEEKPKQQATVNNTTNTTTAVMTGTLEPEAPKKKDGFCYFFGLDSQTKENLTEGNKDMKELLGGKGANLCEMCNLGINVPPGFTVSTEACEHFSQLHNLATSAGEEGAEKKNLTLPENIQTQVDEYLKKLEQATGKKFTDSYENDTDKVLLISVRSGAAISMPGMMDTILNLGICDKNITQLVKNFGGNEKFAWDSYRSLVQMFGEVVMSVKPEHFEDNIKKQKEKRGITHDSELNLEEIQQIVQDHKLTIFEQTGGEDFPQDVRQQLYRAIIAVFNSWHNKRAVQYRKIHNITGLKGTAVNIQSMVFGNVDERSCSGVCFSRNPSTGENLFYGEYMIQAQGEAIVAGQRTPEKIETLATNFPECNTSLKEISTKLEKHFKDVQDMEFTIEQNTLYMLQCRNGKKTIQASLKIYCDMIDEGLINEREAISKIDATQLNQMLHPFLDDSEKAHHEPLATGLPASPGAVVGRIAFTSEQAIKMSETRKEDGDVILVREQTSTEDLAGMHASQGFLTTNGGLTSHAAVVSRQQGKCCVSGCSLLYVTSEESCTINGTLFNQGDIITIDGSTGNVYGKALKTTRPGISQPDFVRIMDIEKKYRTMSVYANADTSVDAHKAVEFGAEGIGLCRTEHMFFEKTRIVDMRRMIVASTTEKRQEAINVLKDYQRSDFLSLFHAMEGKKVTIRLLDPPLHEFLPEDPQEIEELALALGESVKDVTLTVSQLKEKNPMLGHRGCRLGITFPEITQMQVEAIFEAAIDATHKGEVVVDIMVPLVQSVQELVNQKEIIEKVASSLFAKHEDRKYLIHYRVGCMIETPRAVLMAKELAGVADFFSIGSNDLTQMTFGFSRDDSGKFLKYYLERDLIENDPFEVLDTEGVGKIIQLTVQTGREAKNGLTVGLCGEHGGESHSVKFLYQCGLSYVSCSPYRIPIARLSAAQESVKNWRNVICVNGGPGSGKGTQCAKLVEKYGFIHYSTGDLLRAEAAKDTEQGRMISSYIKEGKIVPGAVTLGLLRNAILNHPKKDATFLIDGFPREMQQAVDFEAHVCKFKFVLFFDCPEEILEQRLLERGKTSGRSDDNAESIKKRFKTYSDQTMPVIGYFKKTDRVKTIDSSKTQEEVFAEVCKLFD
ncbi:pyruvate phosphate dikinase [Naegleria gruberi]|uniref:Pyruvate phosphate dikinase n=1 Tax=Naegleria gruberi TaxID=5762 RepID=D2VVU5_NAEGR|nr:pyruvate phosphate dikinase [Naegleria gruberi]EFC39103.1 pyruvate phosphate dikinase [Naegleria gruberi]|eukprot:XP_002671847.1 pyruvate phosphate dikinase [Naegleria gruberi strain NEG-M]